MTAGMLLIGMALLLTCYNWWDANRAQKFSEITLKELSDAIEWKEFEQYDGNEIIPEYRLNSDVKMPAINIEGRKYIGILEIGILNIKLPVLKEWNYANLRIAPCCYQGSVYQENMILAGHNYDSHFGTLKYLQPGDQITFTDIDGNQFHYTVMKIEILERTDVDKMAAKDVDFTLFTCTIGGKNRVTIRCAKNKENGINFPVSGNR